ncbi:hypothetical protein Nepgr_023690 [Nepenthes gracilis]|uniref:Uncharacterized protein n=1 Tax=Nepenthes gracilis TaxID=150966 RepID=A0AAD3T306_NEPGR|nr:hypothetical protein Nepgr_023690 [Nepenthes gracilis]
MFRSKSNLSIQCKKHPKHHQSPGVCSVCLTEKLSKLPTAGPRVTASAALPSCPSSSSSLSDLSSSYVSSCQSPHDSYLSGCFVADARAPTFGVLNKSRSTAFVSWIGGGGSRREVKDYEKKKSGFWFRLLRSGRKRKDHQLLMHSQPITTRDEVTGRRASCGR